MLSSFFQKPIGIVTLLGVAVGGPYVAFETDAGIQLRQSLVSRLAQSPNVKKVHRPIPNHRIPILSFRPVFQTVRDPLLLILKLDRVPLR